MSAFHFEALPANRRNAIRILYLSPGAPGSALFGSLRVVSLDDARFEALSYEWGHDQERHHTLSLQDGNGEIRITEALHSALAQLRYQPPSTDDRVIWADGICINQDDLEERAQQVAIMELIYRRASRVITYIGPEKDESSDAIKLGSALRVYAMPGRGAPSRSTPEDLVNAGFPPLWDPSWQALQRLFLRTWASRCWCALEFLLNKNLTIMCGRVEFPWYLLAELCLIVFMRRLPESILPRGDPLALTECLTHMSSIRSDITHQSQKYNLLDLLKSFHPFRTSDPRDKIYAVLGLAADRASLDLAINYTVKAEDLYFTAIQRSIVACPNLKFLSHNLGKKLLDLPSWVPDWSTWVYGSLGVNYDCIYSASGRMESDFRVNEEERKLDVSGSLVDRITALSSHIGPQYHHVPTIDIAGRHNWLKEQEMFVSSLERYPDCTDLTDVLWRTLIGNLTFDKTYATDDYRLFFDAHRKPQKNRTDEDEVMAKEYIDAVRRKSRNRRLATTSRGYLAAVPEQTKIGDCICLLHGARSLFTIREKGQNFTFIGPAYVQGLMEGEFLESEGYEARKISLV